MKPVPCGVPSAGAGGVLGFAWMAGALAALEAAAGSASSWLRRAGYAGPEDLQIIGGNLINPRRRTEVLETAVQTAARQVRVQLATARYGTGPARESCYEDLPAGDEYAAAAPARRG